MKPVLWPATRFGIVSGTVWALLVGGISNYFDTIGEGFTVFVAGALTGVAISLILAIPVTRCGRGLIIATGLFSLPLGGFVFGVTLSTTQSVLYHLKGPAYRYVEFGWDPIKAGAEFAVLGMISIFGLVFFPLALTTTYCLRRYLMSVPNYA
jgi:hypothetical protein